MKDGCWMMKFILTVYWVDRWTGNSYETPSEGFRVDSDGVRSSIAQEGGEYSSDYEDHVEEPTSQFPVMDSEVELEKSNILIMVGVLVLSIHASRLQQKDTRRYHSAVNCTFAMNGDTKVHNKLTTQKSLE